MATVKIPFMKRRTNQWWVRFRHPCLNGRIIHRSIKTSDDLTAMKISRGLQNFINNTYWHSRAKREEAERQHAAATPYFYDPITESDVTRKHRVNVEYCVWSGADDHSDPQRIATLETAIKEAEVSVAENILLKKRVAELEALMTSGGIAIKAETLHSYTDTCKDYLQQLKLHGGHKGTPCSPVHLRQRTRHLEEFWTAKLKIANLEDIRLHDVMAVARQLLQGDDKKTGKTVMMHLESLRAMLAWAKKMKFITENVLAELPSIDTSPQEDRRALTEVQIAALIAVAPTDRRLIYLTALCTGYRKGELTTLRVDNLQGDMLTANRRTTKNKLGAFQPVPAWLAVELRALTVGKAATEPSFALDYHIDRLFKRDLTAAGITDQNGLVFHSLRHTYATLLGDAGVPMKDCQTLLRHSDPKLTMNIYSHSTAERLRSAVESIGKVVQPKSA